SFVKNMLSRKATTRPTSALRMRVRSSSKCSMNDIRSMPSSSSSSSSSGGGGGGGGGGGFLTVTGADAGSGAKISAVFSIGADSTTLGGSARSVASGSMSGSS